MTLETLANDIAAAAETDAKALIAEAKAEAKQLIAEAEAKASTLREPVSYTHLTLPTIDRV